uniref:Uncharacterized protein n=1 Tax=Rhabditophanes sp. KR3021 TaxID=114890 RepID=A0AC35TXR9_9BILA
MCLNTIKRLEVFLSNEEKDALYDCLKEIGIRVREYWEAVSGNGVNKIMKNIEKFLQILPDRNIIKDIKAILKQISQVYSLIFEAKLEDEMKLEEALDGLADAFMCGTFSKDYNITPKAHTLVCHAIEQLKLDCKLILLLKSYKPSSNIIFFVKIITIYILS